MNIHQKGYSETLEILKNNTNALVEQCLNLISYSYLYNIALVLIEKEPLTTIQFLNKSTITINVLFDISEGRKFEKLRFNLTDIQYFPDDIYFNATLNSRNLPEIETFARNNILFDEAIRHKRNNKIFEWPEVFLALSYFILDDKINFENHLERAKLSKTKSASLKGYIEMISGIANKDENLFHTGVNLQLQWFKRNRESRESIGYPYNFPVMGFINLARFKGMNIELESPHIHPKLVEELPPDFIFEGIPEVYKALEIAENKKNGVMGKLKNWFS